MISANYDPGNNDGSGGTSGSNISTDQSYLGGSSLMSLVDTTHFDLISPNPNLMASLRQGATHSGSVSTLSGTAVPSYRWAFGAFGGDQGYPQAVAYHQQRRVFASTDAQPQTLWMSRIGAFIDFSTSVPSLDDDAVTFTLNSGQLNAVNGMLSLRQLLLLTTDNEWIVSGGSQSDAITPSSIQFTLQGYRGSSKLPPLGIGNVALYVQAMGQIVRDIGYEFASDSYSGNDLTVMAAHLLARNKIVSWAYAQVPFSVIWSVRDDGILLGSTYMREQQIIGWHRHDTDGLFESVAVIPEGDEHGVYLSVCRVVNGQTVRYIERMASRKFETLEDAFFVDCGLTFDGRTGYRGTAVDHTATTVTITGGTNWNETEQLTATFSDAFLAYPGTTDLGDEIVFVDADGNMYRLQIQSLSSSTVATVVVNKTLPAAYRGAARTDWRIARGTISGLDHLEGKTVSVLAEGGVQNQKVVTGGAITLDRPSYVATIGLPYTQDLQTLDIVEPQRGPIQGKRKSIQSATLIVEEAVKIQVGRDFDHLETRKPRVPANYDQVPITEAGNIKVSFPTPWDLTGSLCVRNDTPTPISVLGIIPEVNVGD